MAIEPAIETTADELQARAADWLADTRYPGATVTVVDGAETVLATGLGRRRLDPPADATAGTRFPVGSATKPVTALAVLALVERGALTLDTPVGEHFPPLADAPGDPVTVRELLSHTGGFPQDDVATAVLGDQVLGVDLGPELPDRAAFEAYVANRVADRFLDRERFLYYNSGYAALGAVVESVTGSSFAAAVEELVLAPLGLDTATFDPDVLDTGTGATPYLLGNGGPEPAGFFDHFAVRPPGGLLASAEDLAALLSGVTTGDHPVGEALFTAATTPEVTVETTYDGDERAYGLGWFVEPFDGDVLVGHSGDAGTACAYVGFLRESGLGAAVACTGSGERSPENIVRELLAAATGRDPARVLADRGVEQAAAAVEGRYECPEGVHRATVEWTGDGLAVDYENPMDGERLEYAPTSPAPDDHEFVRVGDDGDVDTVEFLVDAEPTAMRLQWSRLERVGDRPTAGDGPPDTAGEKRGEE